MNLCLRNVFVSLWLFYTSLLSAQIGLSLPVLNNVNSGALVSMPVKVTNFDSITSMQFVIRWDPAVLQYFTTDQYNLSGLDGEDFGTLNTLDSGILRFAWSPSNLSTGVTLPDETAIFRVRLKALGPVNTGSTVIFGEAPPTDFEITQLENGNIVARTISQVNLTPGFVAIGYTVPAGEPAVDPAFFSLKVMPNPFYEKTQISFDLDSATDVQIAVTDATGRILLEKTMPQLSQGQHGMEIVSHELREKGMYYLILRTKTRLCVQPLFVF